MSWIDENKFCLLLFFVGICFFSGGIKALGMIRGKVADINFGGPELGLTQKDRTLFIKISYAWIT